MRLPGAWYHDERAAVFVLIVQAREGLHLWRGKWP